MGDSLHRSARIAIRATKAQRRRLYGLLRSAGDVRALVLDCNRQLREWRLPEMVSYRSLCREIAGMSFGELDMVAARSVIRHYSTGWAEAARRRKAGMVAGFPPPQEGPPGGEVVPRHVPHRRRPPPGSRCRGPR
jgi:hypothetical protein